MKQIEELKKPVLSERFDVEDIRKLRDYNSLRHSEMTTQEMIDDINSGCGELLEWARRHAVSLIG